MRQDGNKFTALLAVLVVGQTIIIGALFNDEEDVSLGHDVSLIKPMTAEERELEREAARAELEASLGARRRASRMASLEKANADAREAVRNLSRRLDETEKAYAALQMRSQSELAAAQAEIARAHGAVANLNGFLGGQQPAQNTFNPNNFTNVAGFGNQDAPQIISQDAPQIVYDQNGTMRLITGAVFTNGWIDVSKLQKVELATVHTENTITVNGKPYQVQAATLSNDIGDNVNWESIPNRAQVVVQGGADGFVGTMIETATPANVVTP